MDNLCRWAIVALFTSVVIELIFCLPPPLRVTIDCGSNEDPAQYSNSRSAELLCSNSRFDVDSFCSMIQQAIPKAIKDGKFVLIDSDQTSAGDAHSPVAVAPPNSFIPKLIGFSKKKSPRLRIPNITVPKLRLLNDKAPRLEKTLTFSSLRKSSEDYTSAERMEVFKKGVQKMLHFVKVLGQIDHYLSERTRIIVDKLSKTFAD